MADRDFRLRSGGATHRVRVRSDGAVEVEPGAEGRGADRVTVDVARDDESTFVVTVGAARHVVHVADGAGRVWAAAAGATFEVESDAAAAGAGGPGAARAGAAGADTGASGAGEAHASAANEAEALSAPMPATVAAVLVRVGDRVAAGDALLRLEAMKMEMPVRAPRAGRVAAVACREGDLVQPGRPLVELA